MAQWRNHDVLQSHASIDEAPLSRQDIVAWIGLRRTAPHRLLVGRREARELGFCSNHLDRPHPAFSAQGTRGRGDVHKSKAT